MVNSSQRKSLMEKFNLTINQLDYKYIETCTNVKVLGRILKVLRSGEEGVYPHLIGFCESRLKSLDPKNILLVPLTKVLHYKDLTYEETKEISADLENWSRSYSENTLSRDVKEESISSLLPPVRTQTAPQPGKESLNSECKDENKTSVKKSPTPRSYKDWDKFDVEKELSKIDTGSNESNTEEVQSDNSPGLSSKLSVEGLSQKEREHLANLEKLKGNEAFKAQDFKESLIYYTRSLSAFKTASAYSNRAQAHIKLQNYVAAVLDCNDAINMEPNNLKALYRRGIAHKEAKMYDLAGLDFSILLELDPENKVAKTRLQEIEIIQEREAKEKTRVVIEELESKTDNESEEEDEGTPSFPSDTGTRLTIEEVQDEEEEEARPLLDALCDCVEDDVPPLSQKTRELLSIRSNKQAKSQAPLPPVVVKEKQSVRKDSGATQTSVQMIIENDEGSSQENKMNPEAAGFKRGGVENSEIAEKKILVEVLGNPGEGDVQDAEENTSECSKALKERLTEGNNGIEEIHEQKLTPFEFAHKWQSNNANTNHRTGASYILSVQPEKLPNILTNKLDAPFLYGILMAIGNVVNSGKEALGYEYLNNLITVPRIELAALFLSNEEKNDIKVILNKIEERLEKDLYHQKKVLKI